MKAETFTTPVQPHPFSDPITASELAELGSGSCFQTRLCPGPNYKEEGKDLSAGGRAGR